MRNFFRTFIRIALPFVFLFTGGISQSFSQVGSDSTLFEDDPILAALDSLYKLDLFERGYEKVNYPINPKYKFSEDSIPRYDEMIYESRLLKLDAASPFDLKYNSVVQGYINMYAFRRRELVSRMMALSQMYFPLFEQSLDKYNLPLELKYLAICESALNPLAKSKSGAMGLWQFMYPTGKMFGLRVSSYVDERCDPHKSTIAACEYFQYLYKMFGDWSMVLAAYNCGPGNVSKAIRRSGGKRTYWEIRPFLPRETQGYVPAFIAVNYIMNHTSEHNIRSAIPKIIFLEVDTVSVKKQLSFYQIASQLDITEDELQYLNPCYRKRIIPFIPGQNNTLTLPSQKLGLFINNEENIYNFVKKDSVPAPSEIIDKKTTQTYVVLKSESLTGIARKFDCTVAEIKAWNHLSSSTIHPGTKLIMFPNSRKQTAQNTNTNSGNFKYYTIKKGDSLYKIALNHNTTVEELKRLNNFGVHYNLLPGKKVKVGVL